MPAATGSETPMLGGFSPSPFRPRECRRSRSCGGNATTPRLASGKAAARFPNRRAVDNPDWLRRFVSRRGDARRRGLGLSNRHAVARWLPENRTARCSCDSPLRFAAVRNPAAPPEVPPPRRCQSRRSCRSSNACGSGRTGSIAGCPPGKISRRCWWRRRRRDQTTARPTT